MTKQARKPGDPPASTIGRPSQSPSLDDPSIPVLTERLTLPPLDLDLEFRLPPAPAAASTESARSAPLEEFQLPPDDSNDSDLPQDDALARITDMPLELDTSLPQFDVPSDFMRDPLTSAPTVPLTRSQHPDEFQLPPLPSQPTAAPPAPEEPPPLTQAINEVELREAILREIARNLPTDVEAIVNQHLEAAVQFATEQLAAKIRFAVAASLHEIVERAVKETVGGRQSRVGKT